MRVPVWLRQTDNTCGTVVVVILGKGPGATFIPDAHRGTSIPALPVCWCPCGRLYWKRNDFSLRTPTGAPADRRCRSAGALVAVSIGNATIFRCGCPQRRQQTGESINGTGALKHVCGFILAFVWTLHTGLNRLPWLILAFAVRRAGVGKF